MLSTPADILSIWLALLLAALCFLMGVALTSRSKAWRVAAVLALGLPSIAIAVWLWHQLYAFPTIVGLLFIGLSIFCGVRVSRDLVRARRRILVTLIATYLAGVLLGPLGGVVFPVLGVWLANRKKSVLTQESDR